MPGNDDGAEMLQVKGAGEGFGEGSRKGNSKLDGNFFNGFVISYDEDVSIWAIFLVFVLFIFSVGPISLILYASDPDVEMLLLIALLFYFVFAIYGLANLVIVNIGPTLSFALASRYHPVACYCATTLSNICMFSFALVCGSFLNKKMTSATWAMVCLEAFGFLCYNFAFLIPIELNVGVTYDIESAGDHHYIITAFSDYKDKLGMIPLNFYRDDSNRVYESRCKQLFRWWVQKIDKRSTAQENDVQIRDEDNRPNRKPPQMIHMPIFQLSPDISTDLHTTAFVLGYMMHGASLLLHFASQPKDAVFLERWWNVFVFVMGCVSVFFQLLYFLFFRCGEPAEWARKSIAHQMISIFLMMLAVIFMSLGQGGEISGLLPHHNSNSTSV